jgi:hypothetical protein
LPCVFSPKGKTNEIKKSKFQKIYSPEYEDRDNHNDIEGKLFHGKIRRKAIKLRRRKLKLNRVFSDERQISQLENERVRNLIVNSSFISRAKFNIKRHENRKAKLNKLLSKDDLAKMKSKIWRDYKSNNNSTLV